MNIINPATEEVIAQIETDDSKSVQKKVLLLRQGHKEWKNVSLKDRISCVERFRHLLGDEIETLTKTLTLETGKTLVESRNEIKGAQKKLEFFINESESLLSPKTVHESGSVVEKIEYVSLGVIANISAWNYPYLVGINIFVPALICGNSVAYKPSEMATLTGQHILRLLHTAGIPQNVIQGFFGPAEVGQALIDHQLDGYYFTGSVATGKKILNQVGTRGVPLVFELGGKDPLYITDQVSDIPKLAENILSGVFYNNGQSCCSVERLYVHENVYDDFLPVFVEAVKKLRVGDPMDSSIDLGPLTRKDQLAYLEEQVKQAVNQGATLLAGGKRLDRKGHFFEPTVLNDVTSNMTIMNQESFGPVIGIQKVTGDEQAIKLMNQSDYGLTASVYTDNLERGQKILEQLESGTGYLNCCDRVSGYLPWSGIKSSGVGVSLSKHGLYSFCRPRGLHLGRP